ncbi:replication initiator [Cryptosporangium aurantiacum]|uniref:Replication initiation protein n=1 Tax=Cryptosporangium aurantiacum TaxID=134849 RepID=A0A1M7QRC6_9ACTN|nr:replication initiator [Cryptosporangium aurantiacum]SHN34052.1 hypothetical protein SAMN05443668_105214 [Cryptosporangium aurantiacum]
MTDPVAFTRRTVDQILDRAGRPDFDRWQQQLQHCGYCSRPVRLRGRITHRTPGGRRAVTYSTHSEPDGVLLVRCGNRRASACPSCSREYAGDMWQLLYAGAAGGRKGVPESIRNHPLIFATLTAPSFGPVHTTREGNRRCHPRPAGAQPQRRCQHGRATVCTAVHDHRDPALGQPLCPNCYSYDAHAAFNWYAPELWRRFTITLRRTLAHRCRMTPSQFDRRARINFVKVAEFQRRGVVHFHALIRLDGPDAFTPPGVQVNVDELADAIQHAARDARLTSDGLSLSFGDQIDTQPVHGRRGLTPERVAAYIAKYATKSADDFGLGDRRITPDTPLDVSDHIARLLDTCWRLGEHENYAGLHRWLHILGFRGHFATKSRRYSITLGAIRAERRAYREAENPDVVDDSTLVVSTWTFVGLGHLTDGDVALAASAAARARERRETAREQSVSDQKGAP